jgi:hypothetical protein
MRILASLTTLALAATLSAGDAVDPAALPVATVDGKPISLRQVEDAMLKKEGTEAFEQWVHDHLAQIDWTKIDDATPIITIGGATLTRKQLALALLKPPGGQPANTGGVREDLINIAVVEGALAKQGVAIGPNELAGAWTSMERSFYAKQKGAHDRIDFASWVRAKEGMAPEEFRKQPGFLMFAGLRQLALKHAREELGEADLMKWFDDHRARYDEAEAVQLADIYVPYRPAKDADGKDVVDDDERSRVMVMMLDLYKNIRDQHQEFDLTWAVYGKAWDQQAGPGGKLGWVTADGDRGLPGARRVPKDAMAAALAAKTFPALLTPVPGPTGVDLIRVDAHRPGKSAVFADLRERVLVDLVEEQLDERMARTLGELRKNAEIRYQSLPDLIDARSK